MATPVRRARRSREGRSGLALGAHPGFLGESFRERKVHSRIGGGDPKQGRKVQIPTGFRTSPALSSKTGSTSPWDLWSVNPGPGESRGQSCPASCKLRTGQHCTAQVWAGGRQGRCGEREAPPGGLGWFPEGTELFTAAYPVSPTLMAMSAQRPLPVRHTEKLLELRQDPLGVGHHSRAPREDKVHRTVQRVTGMKGTANAAAANI
ncbi:PREDICTED: uncharacterized protein LOC106148117 [Chinchilla lanigera]|uniref:uncharacterized protein LOC106148117 n=1 Tax=Chinchilla lanigera TaxID=34839 RepID=UPI00069746D2|nr:PREDICTED: uncharacterized protein LOC106148117 [Chinchilla lanigera]